MKTYISIILAGLFLVSIQSEAATVYGIAKKECKSISFETNPSDPLGNPRLLHAMAWLGGYISAFNMICAQTESLGFTEYLNKVKSICHSNPEFPLVKAASMAITEVNPAVLSCVAPERIK